MAAVTRPSVSVTADTGAGATALDVVEWSLARDLTGGLLPGQARAATGLAKATGSVTFRQGDGATPWQLGPVIPGGACAISAAADVGASTPVAKMTVRQIAADSALSTLRSADLIESVTDAHFALPLWIAGSAGLIEASYVIDQCARALGYRQDPAPLATAVFALSAAGNPWPEVSGGNYALTTPGTFAKSADGRTYLSGADVEYVLSLSDLVTYLPDSFVIAGTMPVNAGTLTFAIKSTDGPSLYSWATITLTATAGAMSVAGSMATGGSGSAGSSIAIDATRRFKLAVSYTTTSMTVTLSTPSATATASSWTGASAGSGLYLATVRVAGPISGVQMSTADDSSLLETPTAFIEPSGQLLPIVYEQDVPSAWSLAQDAATKTLGALWVQYDTLIYRSKDTLRGVNVTAVGTIVAKTAVADLPWSTSIDDVADRVEVTYTPAVAHTGGSFAQLAWSSTSKTSIGAGKTTVLTVDLFGTVDQVIAAVVANLASDGSSTNVTSLVNASVRLVTATKAQITITNTHFATVWLVDTSGNPFIKVWANTLVTAGDEVTAAVGSSAATAVAPLTLELGGYVGDPDSALALANWAASQTALPLAVVDAVDVWPDLSIRIGDVRGLHDPDFTGMVSKVLVAGVQLTGSAGQLRQTLRLVLLPTTEYDLALFFAAQAVTTEGGVATYLSTNLGGSTEAQAGAWLAAKAVP